MGAEGLRRYLRFLIWAVAIVLAAAALGWVPTRRLAGDEGVTGLWAGSAVALLASVLSTLPLVLSPPERRAQAALMATAVRFFAAGILAIVVVLAGWVPARPFLVWLGLSYAALLPLDAHFAARWGRGPMGPVSKS